MAATPNVRQAFQAQAHAHAHAQAHAHAHAQANNARLVEIDQMHRAAHAQAHADTRRAAEDVARLGSAKAQAGRQRAAWITAARAKIASEVRQITVSTHRHRNLKQPTVNHHPVAAQF